MSKFGKYAVIDPVTYHLEKEPNWWWKIKPPTSGDELKMQKFMINARYEVDVDGVRREYPPTTLEVAHRELALCFGGTNIPKDETPVEEGGEPLVSTNANVEVVEAQLRYFPQELVMELWHALGDAVPGWGPVRPNAVSSSEN